jgi:hypothetical protein
VPTRRRPRRSSVSRGRRKTTRASHGSCEPAARADRLSPARARRSDCLPTPRPSGSCARSQAERAHGRRALSIGRLPLAAAGRMHAGGAPSSHGQRTTRALSVAFEAARLDVRAKRPRRVAQAAGRAVVEEDRPRVRPARSRRSVRDAADVVDGRNSAEGAGRARALDVFDPAWSPPIGCRPPRRNAAAARTGISSQMPSPCRSTSAGDRVLLGA